jgi:Ring finger domain/CHY zinc finger
MCVHRNTYFEICCPDCSKYYDCRHCHDAKNFHHMNIRKVTHLRCKKCGYVSDRVTGRCANCYQRGGEYCCLICVRFDDTKEGVFHCNTCNVCDVKTLHKCVLLHDDCSICLSPFLDRLDVTVTPCQHVFHRDCLIKVFEENAGNCPLCRKNLRECTLCDMCHADITSTGYYALIRKLRCKHRFHPNCVPDIIEKAGCFVITCPVCGTIDIKTP